MIDLFLKGGPLMWPILFCSILALAITIHKTIQFKDVLQYIQQPLSELLEVPARHIASYLDSLVRHEDKKQIVLAGSKELNDLEKGVGVLSLIAAIAPLLGLTGTVLGMIDSFRVIAVHGSSAQIGLLAQGIWEALITTAAGLLVAIPVECAYHYLERALDGIAIAMQELSLKFEDGRNDRI
jgi:biopolymer transport protein ExbB